MSKAIYPGSFDPVTLGHLDIIERSAKIVDELVIGVLNNSAKSPLFSVEERVIMLREVTKNLSNVSVVAFQGLLVDFAEEIHANVIIRGLRAVTDFEYELQMTQTNKKLNPDVETIFLTTNVQYSYLSSSIVKEIGKYSRPLEHFVPKQIEQQVSEKLRKMQTEYK